MKPFLATVLLASCLWPTAARAQGITVMASGLNGPGQVYVDATSVYWGDDRGNLNALLKNNPGGAISSFNVHLVSVPVQDDGFLYFVGGAVLNNNGTQRYPIYKLAKGLASATPLAIGDHLANGNNGFGFAIGPGNSRLYYHSEARDIPGSAPPGQTPARTAVIASIATSGGAESVLIWDGYSAPLAANLAAAGLNYWPGAIANAASTDNLYLYWVGDGATAIWRMPIGGGPATTVITGRDGAGQTTTPTTGAAAGSIFWSECANAFCTRFRVMRRDSIGTTITVIDLIDSEFFAVDNNVVVAAAGGAIVQSFIDGSGLITLVQPSQAGEPWGIAVDAANVYWSNGANQIMRVGRPASSPSCSYTVSPTSASFVAAGGSGSVSVTPSSSTCTWTAVSNDSFMTVTSGASGTGSGTVVFTVSALTSGSRSGTLTIAGQTVTVSQSATAASCTYQISPTSAAFAAAGGNGSVTVTPSASTCTWTAVANDTFITVTGGASSTGTGTVTYSVGSLSSGARTGTLTIAGQTLTVTQTASSSSCTYQVSPTSAAFTGAGGGGTVAVTPSTSSCAWTAAANDSFITVTLGGAGTGNGTVAYSVAALATGSRTGTLTVAGQTVTVSQTAPTCTTGCGPGAPSLDRTVLRFAAVSNGGGFTSRTTAQIVHVAFSGNVAPSWTASSSVPWLTVSQIFAATGGTGSVPFRIATQFVSGLVATQTGTITISGAAGTASISVTLTVLPSSAAPSIPFGSFDTPAGGTAQSGSIALTGWTLDDVGVNRVELWRDLQPGETTPPFAGTPTDPRSGKVFIANATLVDGARPDVETAFPTTPLNYRAGWGYLLLTWGLFGQGNGVFKLYAFAFDEEDNVASIGAKTIFVNNNAAAKPFGSIDTPSLGGDAGTAVNFGWALTPKVNGVATCSIPSNGVKVSIDSGPLQPVVYGDARTDVASAFPGFSNTAGAGAHFIYNWSTLANGVHTIGWLVTDDCNRADGIGSRFFTVSNGANLLAGDRQSLTPAGMQALPIEPLADLQETDAPITVARGYGELPEIVRPDPAGSRTIALKQGERIELRTPRGFATAIQLGPDGQSRALPTGSTWDAVTNTFYWEPAPAFLGRFRIVFSNGRERISVRIAVVP